MKKILLASFTLVFLLLSFTTLHKYYVSVTNVRYSEENKALQITTRVFVDDLRDVINFRYGIKNQLVTVQDMKDAHFFIDKYFRTKFLVSINGQEVTYNFIGEKNEEDMVICYLEIDGIEYDKIQSISVVNELLTDLFEEQQNVVHFKLKNHKKSFVLIKENNKGMLKL